VWQLVGPFWDLEWKVVLAPNTHPSMNSDYQKKTWTFWVHAAPPNLSSNFFFPINICHPFLPRFNGPIFYWPWVNPLLWNGKYWVDRLSASNQSVENQEKSNDILYNQNVCHLLCHLFFPVRHSELATTSAPWRMDEKWSGNSFPGGSIYLVNHGI
jgi:hypothetical protein